MNETSATPHSEFASLIAANPAHRSFIDGKAAPGVYEFGLADSKVDREQRLVSGMLTTQDTDAEEEVIVTDGIDLESYYPARVKAVYWNHDYRQLPIGTCRKLVRMKAGLWQQTYIRPGTFGDDLMECIAAGCVGHYSIGFLPLEASSPSAEESAVYPTAVRMIRKAIALEASLVAMPANAMAVLDELATKGLITKATAAKFGLPVKSHVAGKRRVVLNLTSGILTRPDGRRVILG